MEEWAAQKLAGSVTQRGQSGETARQEAERRFARHFGALNGGDSRSADNEKIDADLIRADEDTHDEI